MSEQFKTKQPERYEAITRLNDESDYMTNPNRPFDVAQSIQSAGDERVMYNKYDDDPEIVEAGKAANRLIRFTLGGNMSNVTLASGAAAYGPKDLSSDERLADARKNMERFQEAFGVDPSTVRVLFPDRDYSTPLDAVNIDEDPATYDGTGPVKLATQGDMIYTYNPDIVLGVRPADCPLVVLSAETPKGRIYTMTHFAWEGAARGYMDDMQHELQKLGVDLSTASVYVTPGGQAETFPHELDDNPNDTFPRAEGLFTKPVEIEKNGKKRHAFCIDTPNFVYEGLLAMGLEPRQIFVDTTDTTAPNAGTASHSRSSRLDDDNGRDFVLVKLNRVESGIDTKS